jgi:hypothetical protein
MMNVPAAMQLKARFTGLSILALMFALSTVALRKKVTKIAAIVRKYPANSGFL